MSSETHDRNHDAGGPVSVQPAARFFPARELGLELFADRGGEFAVGVGGEAVEAERLPGRLGGVGRHADRGAGQGELGLEGGVGGVESGGGPRRLDDVAFERQRLGGAEVLAELGDEVAADQGAVAVEGPGPGVAGQRGRLRAGGRGPPSSGGRRAWLRATAIARIRGRPGRARAVRCTGRRGSPARRRPRRVRSRGACAPSRPRPRRSPPPTPRTGRSPPRTSRTSAAQTAARANAARRPPASRSRLQGRSSRRFRPRATSNQSISATVEMPIPPAASRLTTTARAPAPRPAAGTVSRRQSGRPEQDGPDPGRAQDHPAGEEIALARSVHRRPGAP